MRLAACTSSLIALCALAGAGEIPAAPVPRVTLAQATSRRPPRYSPVLEGKTVSVEGRVSAAAVAFFEYAHLAIQDGKSGLVLEGTVNEFHGFVPGDWVRAQGTIAQRGGLPVLRPAYLEVVSQGPAPRALVVKPWELQAFHHLGKLVTTVGELVESGVNAGGYYLLIGENENPLKIFLPFGSGERRREFANLAAGDVLRVTGISSQYCAAPPYNSMFQVLIGSPSAVVLEGRAAPIKPWQALAVLASLGGMAVLFWRRERLIRRQRSLLRGVFGLSEEVLEANSASEIARRLLTVLPPLMRATAVHLYVYRRSSKHLEQVLAAEGSLAGEAAERFEAVSTESPAWVCFQNRTQLAVPDVRRSPFAAQMAAAGGGTNGSPAPPPLAAEKPGENRNGVSLLLTPLLAQSEAEGVLELHFGTVRRSIGPVEREMIQHLANQIGLALKLLDQRSIREQLYRSEKLAAVGQLISGIAKDLEAPLAAIAAKAAGARMAGPAALGQELRAIASEATRASAMVARLVSFARPGHAEAHPVDVIALVRSLIEFREREWKARGIQLAGQVSLRAGMVSGSRGQLEQVLLNLIVHAEQSVADLMDKRISISAKTLAGRALVEIAFAAQAGFPDPFGDSPAGPGLGVCRGIAAAHGGDLRAERTPDGCLTFVLDLPCRTPSHAGRDGAPRPAAGGMTALAIEPDQVSQRRLVEMLGARGLRVVPVATPAEGIDLVQRIRFDLVFCSVSVAQLDYVDVVRRIEARTGVLVVISGIPPVAPPASCLLLTRPVEDNALDEVLEEAESRIAASNGSHV